MLKILTDCMKKLESSIHEHSRRKKLRNNLLKEIRPTLSPTNTIESPSHDGSESMRPVGLMKLLRPERVSGTGSTLF